MRPRHPNRQNKLAGVQACILLVTQKLEYSSLAKGGMPPAKDKEAAYHCHSCSCGYLYLTFVGSRRLNLGLKYSAPRNESASKIHLPLKLFF
jgi:hypothetical protein